MLSRSTPRILTSLRHPSLSSRLIPELSRASICPWASWRPTLIISACPSHGFKWPQVRSCPQPGESPIDIQTHDPFGAIFSVCRSGEVHGLQTSLLWVFRRCAFLASNLTSVKGIGVINRFHAPTSLTMLVSRWTRGFEPAVRPGAFEFEQMQSLSDTRLTRLRRPESVRTKGPMAAGTSDAKRPQWLALPSAFMLRLLLGWAY